MKVVFLRIIAADVMPRDRILKPEVVAFADDHKVVWTIRNGWSCRECEEPGDWCAHVDAVADLLAPNVTKLNRHNDPKFTIRLRDRKPS